MPRSSYKRIQKAKAAADGNDAAGKTRTATTKSAAKAKAKTKKPTASQVKKAGLKKERAKLLKKQLSAGGSRSMGSLANPGEGSLTNSKEMRTTSAGNMHNSTKVLRQAKKDNPDFNCKKTRMHNASYKAIAANPNADAAALILRPMLLTVVGVDDATLDSITKEWINALYDKKAAKNMAKMPRIWLLHKLGKAIDNYKGTYGAKAWNDLAE